MAPGGLVQIARTFVTSAARRSGHGYYQRSMNDMVPFDTNNHYKLTLYFALYFGSAFAIPWLLVRYRLKK